MIVDNDRAWHGGGRRSGLQMNGFVPIQHDILSLNFLSRICTLHDLSHTIDCLVRRLRCPAFIDHEETLSRVPETRVQKAPGHIFRPGGIRNGIEPGLRNFEAEGVSAIHLSLSKGVVLLRVRTTGCHKAEELNQTNSDHGCRLRGVPGACHLTRDFSTSWLARFRLGAGFLRRQHATDQTLQTSHELRTAQGPTRSPVGTQVAKLLLRHRAPQ